MTRSGDARSRACHGCREQKIRCDIVQDDQQAICSRCRRMGLECLKVPPVKRNRNTKAALQRELETLKQQLQHRPIVPQRSERGLDETLQSTSPQLDHPTPGLRPPLAMSLPVVNASSLSADSVISVLDEQYGEQSESRQGDMFGMSGMNFGDFGDYDTQSVQSNTLPRALGGHEYDSRRIDDCFRQFFTHYHPILPVLDATMSPNDCYDQSPFQFWTIVATGCRRYVQDPTMIEAIGPLINNLAFASIASLSAPIQTLQSLLILCTWAAPIRSSTENITYLACGAALNLAMQLGLHVPGNGQDFARDSLSCSPEQVVSRDRLWSFLGIVCPLTNQSLGFPASVPTDVLSTAFRDKSQLSVDLQFYHDLTSIQSRAMTDLMGQALMERSLATSQSQLSTLIKTHEAELSCLALRAESDGRRLLHLYCGRLHVGAFLFYAANDTQALDHDGLVELFDLAIKVIVGTNSTYQYKPSRPDYISTTMLLAACIILRISRSCLASRVDLEAGEKAYFEAIVAIRESSLEYNDLSARGAMVLAQLWNSTRVFCQKDGAANGLGVAIRTRLSMGIVFDCFWWWREEFQAKQNPYQPIDETTTSRPREASPFQTASDVDFLSAMDPAAGQWMGYNQIGLFSSFSGSSDLGFTSL